jgi:hypothetical protein
VPRRTRTSGTLWRAEPRQRENKNRAGTERFNAGEEIQAGPKTEQNPSSSDPAHYAGTVSEKSSGDGKIKNGERPDLGKEQPKTHEEISTKIKSFLHNKLKEISTKIKSFLHNKLNESSTQSEGGYRIHSLI